MTARHKDFGSEGVYRAEDLEPISFDFLGQSYNCRPAVPGAVLLKFISKTGRSRDAMQATAEEFLGFFVHALSPGDFRRFQTAINDPDVVVSVETLVEIVTWLVEQYSERPTTRQSPSEDGLSTTGPTSEAGTSPSEVTPSTEPSENSDLVTSST